MSATSPQPTGLKRIGRADLLRPVRLGLLPPLRLTYATPRPVLPVREDLPYLLNKRGLLGAGAEIGVKTGWFSEVLLDRWKGRLLISIDPWLTDAPEGYVDVANVEQEQHDEFEAETRKRLERFGDRSEIWRAKSIDAADRVLPGTLDFVYIDARHDHDSVVEDLEAWADKVKPGGVMAGHDYVDGMFADGDFGVKSAVDGFFGKLGIPVRHTWGDPPWVSWFAIMPRT